MLTEGHITHTVSPFQPDASHPVCRNGRGGVRHHGVAPTLSPIIMSTNDTASHTKTTTSVIYGTLSEAVAPAVTVALPDTLAAMQRRFGYLVHDYREQRLTRIEFKTALTSLVEDDAAGRTWTIGARTGRFYTRDHRNAPWVIADPNEFAAPDAVR